MMCGASARERELDVKDAPALRSPAPQALYEAIFVEIETLATVLDRCQLFSNVCGDADHMLGGEMFAHLADHVYAARKRIDDLGDESQRRIPAMPNAQWIAAEVALQAARAAVDVHPGEDFANDAQTAEWERTNETLVEVERAFCALEPLTIQQAIRQYEVGLHNGCLAGVDPEQILARMKRLAGMA